MELDDCLENISKGDIQSLECLYNKLKTPVYAFALSMVRSKAAAEDILQDTFIKVYEKASLYKLGNPKAWVLSITRNLSLDWLRRSSVVSPEDDNKLLNLLDTAQSGDAAVSKIIDKMEVTSALLNINEKEREIFVLHVIGGLKHIEIAKLLEIPEGTVRWKYRRALSKLSKSLGGENDE